MLCQFKLLQTDKFRLITKFAIYYANIFSVIRKHIKVKEQTNVIYIH